MWEELNVFDTNKLRECLNTFLPQETGKTQGEKKGNREKEGNLQVAEDKLKH